MSGLYAYGAVREADRSRIPALSRGITGETPELVTAGALAVIVGRIERAPSCRPDLLALHESVVARVFAAGVPVLPFRFGQVLADEAAIAESVRPRAAVLEQALALVSGCVQMTIRLFDRSVTGSPATATEDESRGEPEGGPGTRYLHARKRQLDVPELEPLRAHLKEHVRAEVVRPASKPPLKATLYQLVPAAELSSWRARLAELPVAADRPWTVTGPWAPYAFAAGVER